MKYPKLLGVLLMLAVVLSACSTAATPTTAPLHTLPPIATKPAGTSTAVIPETGGTKTPATGGLKTGTPSTGGTNSTPSAGTPSVPSAGASCATVTVQLHSAAGSTSSGGITTSGTAPSGGSTLTGTGTPSTGTGTSGTATSGGASSGTTTTANEYLVDCNGHALYVTTDDTPNSGSSSCTDACTDQWQPLTVSEGKTPMAGTGVDDSLLSTITRADGTTQVTYNGWPLYLYTGDTSASDKMGQGMEGKWFLLGPDGNPIKE